MTMLKKTNFSSQQQFHLLIDFNNDERCITVLPGRNGQFRLLDQGTVLGDLGFDQNFDCISDTSDLGAAIHNQLGLGIKNHY